MEPAGSSPSFVVLDRDILENEDLSLTEKVVLAYLYAADECEPQAQTADFCARFLDLSESETKRAIRHIESLGLLDEEDS